MADDKSALPARQNLLDRQALERVLARAAELQGAGAVPESGELLSESQLLDIGKEVGLSSSTLSQALAEERTRVAVPEERGFIAQIAGAAFASATRTVPGNQRDVMATLDWWMQHEECLQVERRFADRITWETQRGLFGKLKRTVNLGGRGYHLVDASRVSGTVVPVDGGRVLVRLDADVSSSRARRVGMGALLAGGTGVGGAVLGLALVVANIPLIIAAGAVMVPLAGGSAAAYALARGHRTLLGRMQLSLEQILDRLEHGEMKLPTPLLGGLGSLPRLPRR